MLEIYKYNQVILIDVKAIILEKHLKRSDKEFLQTLKII
jgi:hypothetical protein